GDRHLEVHARVASREESAAPTASNLREATPVARRQLIDSAGHQKGPENAGYEKDRAEQTADEWQ
ncbi:MAG: hypothetical protein ACJ760_02255, partial [Thermoleophilaceae bacterium]